MAGPQAGSKSFQCRTFVLLNSRIANVVFLSSPRPYSGCFSHIFPFFSLGTGTNIALIKGPSNVKPAVLGTRFFVLGLVSLSWDMGTTFYLAVAKDPGIGKETFQHNIDGIGKLWLRSSNNIRLILSQPLIESHSRRITAASGAKD